MKTINENEKRILEGWFLCAFGKKAEQDVLYFGEWLNRYQKGLDWFISRMDSKRREAWESILIVGLHSSDEDMIKNSVILRNATMREYAKMKI